MTPEKMSLEEYLGKKGLRSPVCDYGLDKVRLPHGETARQRERRLKESVESQNEYAAQRCAAIREYREKVNKGEIVPKTAMERRLDVARGHPDNPATQAARRILERQGIDWQTGKPLSRITEREINMFWRSLEGYGFHCGGWNEEKGKSAICAPTPEEGGGKVLGWVDKELKVEWTAPISEIAAATLDAANEYYVDGQTYLVEGGKHLCVCHRWIDNGTGIRGINFEGTARNLFCDPEHMGTFLPGVAAKELEISRVSELEAHLEKKADFTQDGQQADGPSQMEELEAEDMEL